MVAYNNIRIQNIKNKKMKNTNTNTKMIDPVITYNDASEDMKSPAGSLKTTKVKVVFIIPP